MAKHTIRQGEHLAMLAKQNHLSSWRAIYDAPENQEIRSQRPDPNVLEPGDEWFIPEVESKQVDCATDQCHRFRTSASELRLRIVVCDHCGEPLGNKRFEIAIGEGGEEQKIEGQTDGEGLVDQPIPAELQRVRLSVWNDPDAAEPWKTWQLKVGSLNPVEDITGYQARLKNLGYYKGAIDGESGPQTEAALRAFQQHAELPVDGEASTDTLDQIKSEHGS